MKTRTIEVVVVNRNGWYVATCKELEVSGFGESQAEALKSFEKALFSTMRARMQQAVSEAESEEKREEDVFRYPLGAPAVA